MRRERKELFKKIDELQKIWDAENRMGCGEFAREVAKVFSPQMDKLVGLLAATYGMGFDEYIDKQQNLSWEELQREQEAMTAGRMNPALV